MSMIQISNENLAKLERFQFLLEDENVIQTLDFILNTFDSEIELFICQYVEREEHEIYINSDEYKELLKKTKKEISDILESSNV